MLTRFLPKQKPYDTERIKILLVGNNPIELSGIYEQLTALKDKMVDVYVSFNEKEVLKNISNIKPQCIIVDDNYGTKSSQKLIRTIRKIRNRFFYLTLLKTSNTNSIMGFNDYFMKEGVTADRLYNSFKKGLLFKNRISKSNIPA